jgi:M6 family metalloprotease-like protein
VARLRVLLLLAPLLAACAPAHAAATLKVRPLVHPEEAARLAERGLVPRGELMRPGEIQAAELRARAARRFPHVLAPPGVDVSRRAERRFARPRGATSPRRAAAAAGVLGTPPETLHVAFLRIDFLDDRGGSASTGNGRFDLSGPDEALPPIDRPPHNRTFYQRHGEALARYYDVQAYGRVVVEVDVWPRSEDGAYSVSDMADFGPWAFSPDIYGAAVHMFRTFLFAADSQSTALGDRVPWDAYDHLVILHAGSDLQDDLSQDSELDIPSFTIGVGDTDVVIFPDSANVPITAASFVPETISQDRFYGAINGVLAHECGHLFFNFFDVYDIASGYPVCGYWSLMDSGNLLGARVGLEDGSEIYAVGLLPPSLDPFHRAFITDAITWETLPDGGEIVPLGSSQRDPDIRVLPLTSDESLVIENRWVPRVNDVQLDQDTTTHVVLGPKDPDRFEYDGLLPGGGLLVWHLDESVIPLENAFPLDTALRVNPDFGLNSNPLRPGLEVVEADGLDDLGDPSSPLWLASHRDPFFVGNNSLLSDTTAPSLIPRVGTRPHLSLEVLDPDTLQVMRVRATRGWNLPGWPVRASFPPGGPMLLAVDADGDDTLDVCWAGGSRDGADSAGVFVLRSDGRGLGGGDPLIATLDRRPNPVMAALATGPAIRGGAERRGPAWFAVTTQLAFPGDTEGGKVWVLDHLGLPLAGWPAALPARVTTPPVFVEGGLDGPVVFVGCDDGRVYEVGLTGAIAAVSPPLGGPIAGRLAVLGGGLLAPQDAAAPTSFLVAAGTATGEVGVLLGAGLGTLDLQWTRPVAGAGFEPDLLWIPLADPGATTGASCATAGHVLVARDLDRLHGFCPDGTPLPGWGRTFSDTLVAALGAGDPDRDGLPEVLVQTVHSGVGFVNATGAPSPGWPRRTTPEDLPSRSAPLAVDVDGDGRTEVLAMNASGMLAALRADGRTPAGWPLATGAGAAGAPVVADLDGDGTLEMVAGDNVATLWGYALPATGLDPRVSAWTMLGGDAGRTSALPEARVPVALAPAPGPYVNGSLKAYPNPARRKPVTFAWMLSEPARVEFRILDTSGHEVASFARDGDRADNLFLWEPGSLPAGLYLAQVRFQAQGREQREVVQVGILR